MNFPGVPSLVLARLQPAGARVEVAAGHRRQRAEHNAALVQGRALPSREAPGTDPAATTSLCSPPIISPLGSGRAWLARLCHRKPRRWQRGPSPTLTLPWAPRQRFGNMPAGGMADLHVSPSLAYSAIGHGQCWREAQSARELQRDGLNGAEEGSWQLAWMLPFTSAVINPQPGLSLQPQTTPELGTGRSADVPAPGGGCGPRYRSQPGLTAPNPSGSPAQETSHANTRYFSHPGPVGVSEHTSQGGGLLWGPARPGKAEQHGRLGRDGEMHGAAVAPSEPLPLERRAQPSAPLNNRANESLCQQVCSSPACTGKDPGGETCFTDLAPSPPSWLRRGRVWGCGGGRVAWTPLRDTARRRRRRRSGAGAASPVGQGAGGCAGRESETPLGRCRVSAWLLACLRSLAPPLIS